MININHVIVSGRATRDAELKYTEGGAAFLNIGIAINENYKDKSGDWQEKTAFVNATLWGKAAERLSEQIVKGIMILIDGKLTSYTKEVDGQKRTIVSINAYKVQLVEKNTKSKESTDEPYMPDGNDAKPEEEALPF